MKTSNPLPAVSTRVLALHDDQIHRLHGASRLRVTRGTVWLTVTGQSADHLLLPGDRFTLDRGRDALVEAMSGRACIVVTERVPSWTHRVAATLHAASRRFVGALA